MSNRATSSLIVNQIAVEGYEKVFHFQNPEVGLEAIISIHDMNLGPTLGGIRIHPYASFDAALNDVLRLSKGMTYKSALAECKWGGGKSVIIADPKSENKEKLLEAFAECINYLQGDYIGAEDVGCTPKDMAVIAKFTPYVVGLEHQGSSGNPSPYTAWGTFRGIQALMQKIYGTPDLEGRTVAVQGLGSVGSKLCEFLFWHGAKLIVSDIDEEKAKKVAVQFNAQYVSNTDINRQSCDVLAPCAMGGTINAESIPNLRCRAIGGCANNQLLSDVDGEELKKLGILYAPDFVINSGGLINVTQELEPEGYNPGSARNKTNKVYDQLLLIFDIAEQNSCSTNRAAISLAEYRIKYGIGKRLEPVQFPFAKN